MSAKLQLELGSRCDFMIGPDGTNHVNGMFMKEGSVMLNLMYARMSWTNTYAKVEFANDSSDLLILFKIKGVMRYSSHSRMDVAPIWRVHDDGLRFLCWILCRVLVASLYVVSLKLFPTLFKLNF